MKGGGITGGAGASSVTPFMLHNLTKSLSESAERGVSSSGSARRQRRVKHDVAAGAERVLEQERDRVRVLQQQARRDAERERCDGVVVCKERAGGVQWKYVSKNGRARDKAMQVMHAKQHRDPLAVGFFSLLPKWCSGEVVPRSELRFDLAHNSLRLVSKSEAQLSWNLVGCED